MNMTSSPLPASPRASVIIPNWNGLALLRPCLDSLRQQTWPHLEVIVVDNASTDDSVSVLAREYPEVRVLALQNNAGYSGGCNAGMGVARGDILVFLNNDIEADAQWLEELVVALDRHAEAGSAASRIMLYDRRDTLNSAGDLYRRNGLPDSRGVWQLYGPPYDEERWVFGGCGGAVALRRSTIEAIGPFEERFFMYCEDVDLNWRAQLSGHRCIYAPRAVIYHHLSATGGGKLASYYVGRNTLWVIARNYPTRLLRRHWRGILAAQWAITQEALRAWRGEAARARLRGQLAGLFTWPRWLSARHAIQVGRQATDEYIESILDQD
jgi:GT2 family glycosyltransferase